MRGEGRKAGRAGLLGRGRGLMRGAACGLFVAGASSAPGAGTARVERVEVSLIPAVASVAPGKPFAVAVRLRMDEKWHVYWKNPADSGFPTKVAWTLPEGFEVAGPRWPAPERVVVGGVVSYAWHGEAWLLFDVTPPAALPPGPVKVGAEVGWLMCREICVPGEAKLALELPQGDGAADSGVAGLFAAAEGAIPKAPEALGWRVAAADLGGAAVRVQVAPKAAFPAGAVLEFFPDTPEQVRHDAEQRTLAAGGGLGVDLPYSALAKGRVARLTGVAVVRDGSGKVVGAAEVDVPVDGAGVGGGLGGILWGAFLGGLILNVMPCVLPVISLKVLGFVRQGEAHGGALGHGLVFAAGVVLSFLALAGLLIGLRAAGQELGWGFQFQAPGFLLFLCVLVLLITMSLFGVFEIGTSMMGVGSGLAAKEGFAGSFFSGVLATTLATPCTAPFMGAAVGFALAEPPVVTLAVFAALGVGMAAPYVLLTADPRLLRFLPKPGAWMERFKQFCGFPMLATLLWLVWVFASARGVDAAAGLGVFLVALALGVWLVGSFAGPVAKGRSRALAWAAAAVCAGAGWVWGGGPAVAEAGEKRGIAWEAWSAERVAALQAEGRPVFVDFTAAWCLSCKANEASSLEIPATVELFRARNVAALKGDWTRFDPEIKRALEAHGRAGVPLYLVYPGRAGAAPAVLPELLTPGIVAEAVGRAAEL